MKKETVVLAYSGGLDTSVCIHWLSERGYRVIGFCVDVGQGVAENFGTIRKRGLACGAGKILIEDKRESFAEEYILPALKAGAIYEGKYLLATALSRPLIAKALAETARKEKATAVAHGCTGKGNDQVRIEVSLRVLNPRLKILAPVREWEMKSRQEEMDYARRKRIPIPPKKDSVYSLDQNLWGIAIESGPLEDPWTEPPAAAYRWTTDPAKAPNRPETVTIEFQRGKPVGLNGKKRSLIAIIEALNTTGAKHGVGRVDMIEDRLVGIKSREVYEAPAATILHAAHKELEHLTLDRETLSFKELIAQRYSRLIYDGLWFTPMKQAFDAFVESTQRTVTGQVKVKLFKGTAMPVGRKSPYSRYAEKLATYSGKDAFDQKAAAGFIQLWGLPYVKR